VKERSIAGVDVGTTRVCTTVADLKLRVAEHIIAQDDYSVTDEVQNILAETKAGAWRRPALLEKLKKVFSAT